MNLIEFIEQVLITEIRMIQQDYATKHTYLSFGLLSQGIELLGSLTDEFDIGDRGHGKKRFNRALEEFFNASYKRFADNLDPFNLYSNLRCGMLHIVIPKIKIALGERKNDLGRHKHLDIVKDKGGNNRLFLMAEDFYEDFRCACKKVIDMVKDGSIYKKYPDLQQASQTKKDIIDLKRDFLNTNLILASS